LLVQSSRLLLVHVHTCDRSGVGVKISHVESESPTFHENAPAEPESVAVVNSASSASEGAIGRNIAANNLNAAPGPVQVESSARQGKASDEGALDEDGVRGPTNAHAAAKAGARYGGSPNSSERGFDTTTKYATSNHQNGLRAGHEDRTTNTSHNFPPRELDERQMQFSAAADVKMSFGS
jgi:hypothetical protein